MISLKSGVRVAGLQPEMLLGLIVVAGVYGRNHYSLVITSITDGTHGDHSLHYQGQAIDCRTHDLSVPMRDVIVRECKESLGPDYDVVLEDDHLHVEYDPK